jgi:protein-L-isoaspartate(D-aspartate) O-methyltransferase
MNSTVRSDSESFAAFLLRMRSAGLDDKRLFAAIEATPRRTFIPGEWQSAAYSDRMVPIECGETIEGLDLQALIISALQIEPGHRILEIGTGSGFTAAVMGRLARRVTTVERFHRLADAAKHRISSLGMDNVFVRLADGRKGLPEEGPYDRIVAWATFESVPRDAADWLATSGVMIAPIGPAEGQQKLARLTKIGSRFEREDIGTVRLQPLAEKIAAVI